MVYLTDIQRIVDIALVRAMPGGKELTQEMAEIIAVILFSERNPEIYELFPCGPTNSN